MRKVLFFISLFFCVTTCFGQFTLKKAERLFDEMAYTDAVVAYEKYLKAGHKPKKQVKLHIADSYYYINNYAKAQSWYERVGVSKLKDVQFNNYVQALKAQGAYEKANEVLFTYLKSKRDSGLLKRFEEQRDYLDSINALEPRYTINNIEINTDRSDFGTAFYGDKIIYSSAKDTVYREKELYKWNRQPFLDLYIAAQNIESDSILIDESQFLPKQQNRYHTAGLVFTEDLQTIYYSTNTVKGKFRLQNDDAGTNNIRIMKANITDEKFEAVQVLPFNDINYSVGHPALTPDGKWLFFISDMPGGYGATDIYKVEVLGDGKYGDPMNLGATVNTEGKEMFPFISDNILYFSSDGYFGMGGLDVYETKFTADFDFEKPKNLGSPVNSNFDDFAYIVSEDNSYGYFSSNRTEGKGDDDIYYFTKNNIETELECKHILTGIVTDAISGEPIEDVTIKVSDVNGEVIGTGDVTTNVEGKYILTEVPCNFFIMAGAFKKGYSRGTGDITTPGAPSGEVKIDFQLDKYSNLVVKKGNVEKIKINPIHFDFDKHNINKKAELELNKVVYMLKKFPDIHIKIESHTDSRGSDVYNEALSQRRATSTYNYIISKGVDASRIESVKGYGEKQLRNRCSNGVPCTKEEHLYNRRSDFIIVNK